jgi:hypothetical protein
MNINNFIHHQKKQIEGILLGLTRGFISNDEYDSTQVGFFIPDKERKLFEIGNHSVPDMPLSLNQSIQLMYRIIGDPDKEVYLGEWTIMSLNKVLGTFENLKNKGQSKIFDIAFRYIGLGHIDILSCDLTTHKLFHRRDGGANGWEREIHHQEAIDMDPTEEKQYFFREWFNNCIPEPVS